MPIIKAAIGSVLKEFGTGATLSEIWNFLNDHFSVIGEERSIVLMDDSGATVGEIWDSSLYFAHCESPAKMRAYFSLLSFE